MPEPTVVVVGAGQAGCQTVFSLREAGFAGRVLLVGAEQHLPYQRPPLSKAHLTGSADRDTLWLRPRSWFAEHGVEVRTGTRMTALHREDRELLLDDGEVLAYDKLVLALGARHRELPVAGTGLDGVVRLRTLDEADDVRDRLRHARRVVVVGGGFIGMEVAATAARLGKSTTVIEVADRLMGRVLSAETAAFLLRAHRSRGVETELGTTVATIVGTAAGTVAGVDTTDGRRIPADLVLVGVGAVPNVEPAAAAGIEVDNGIAVDESLRTSDPHVYAIGDCVSFPQVRADGRRVRLESVQNAVAQGRRVAATLAGRPGRFDSIPWFWSDQADLKLQIAGLTSGHHEVVVKGDRETERFSAYCFADGRLLGVESVNRPADHMAARRLLAAPTPVTPDQVRAADFSPKAVAAGTATG
ncbi:NAD(P)/FAD-dependent oxidoreductase [Streptomyces sp. GQFP]|uniref:NAD(P)/FAD-dependent oxidoreductase n=1 Tax=Streptomyces sp. GQFP TaxID=2907545 RepID=UPI001F30B004|nr:FAD-dependent oxidoreductase [Streptomyces sp. GQFP]UIX29390.1 FAD-dependent oxidoreductase [Streptomyces sp. GQFP]